MLYFPFTFLFNVPGLTNPFASSAPATVSETVPQSITKRLKRNLVGAAHSETETETVCSALLSRKRPPPSGPPPARLVRKRGWQPSSVASPQSTVISQSTTSTINTGSEHHIMSRAADKGKVDEDVVLDLPPSKRRRGLTESVISTAFNAALVGAAVGLTVLRLWKDAPKEVEQSPPPPYQEEWADPTRAPQEPETPEPTRLHRAQASVSSHKRHAVVIRHRQKAVRKSMHIKRDRDLSPRKPSPQFQQDESVERSFIHGSVTEDDTLDEMDWIGGRLAQLIEEGKRALGKEIVVASEAPEDEVDDGSGNWVEEDPEPSFSSLRRVIPSSPSKRSRNSGAASNLSSFPSHSRFLSDDLTASFQSTPIRPTGSTYGAGANSTSLSSQTCEVESPSIRESMERARAAYLQKRGLGIDTEGTRY